MRRLLLMVAVLLMSPAFVQAKVDLVTLPERDSVQLTIYNSADLTLARESRRLVLRKGNNQLQFSWVNTLIDPTSLEMIPKQHFDKISINNLIYPPRTKNLGVWRVESGLSSEVPVEINYLTSGLSWRAFYLGTLSPDESKMRLEGYVRVMNNSGEDYENAQVRLIVGQVHLIDQIAELARREYAYGRPAMEVRYDQDLKETFQKIDKITPKNVMLPTVSESFEDFPGEYREKEIIKEGLSEYFLYTIEGTETIPNGWSKRLPSLEAAEIPVINLYKYEEERYGSSVVRFLSFKNDKEHQLGETPIPGGEIKVFRVSDKENHLSYEGGSNFKYIPVDEDVELNLGSVNTVIVEPTMMAFKTKNYTFDKEQNISGWDEEREFKIVVKNTRDIPVKIEIKRNFGATKWDLRHEGDRVLFEKVDADTVKFELMLDSRGNKEFKYVLTTYYGSRADKK